MRERTAVLLNQNARKVNSRLINKIKHLASRADIFVTHSLSEANDALENISKGGYDLFFTGGGDGTVCHAVTRLSELCNNRKAPAIGILPLGTGNAIASFLESPSVERCLNESSEAAVDTFSFASAQGEHGEHKAAFGGFGWDAFILDRYYKWKKMCKAHTLLKPLSEGLHAYLLSGLGWAVPAMLLKPPRWDIQVRNGDDEAWRVDEDGYNFERIAPREIIYEGPSQFFSFGTCPFFGFRMNALPFAAARPDLMHLKIADLSPLIPAMSLRKLWNGTFKHDRIWNFLVSGFKVELSHKAAMQMGGDIIGHMTSLDVGMSQPAAMLRYGPYQGLRLPYHPVRQVA
jgi:diacylglycerol kinase family enzyme